jgi:hypothetical protein
MLDAPITISDATVSLIQDQIDRRFLAVLNPSPLLGLL